MITYWLSLQPKSEAMRKLILILIVSWVATLVDAQTPVPASYPQLLRIGEDSLPHVYLGPITIYGKAKFKSRHEEEQYWRLVGRVKKVYPYAKEAGRLFEKYQVEVPPDAKGRERRKYVRKAEDELMELYGPKLKEMSISDGRILIKLIDRETHYTSYELIDNVKGSVPAFLWQGVARVFGNNLKAQYDPYGEDRQIEMIIYFIESGLI